MLISQMPQAVLVPIPLHKSRESERGFNQSNLIAHELSRMTGVPVGNFARRIRKTSTQAKTTHKNDRTQNTREAFECIADPTMEGDPLVILVDDVITSGATMLSTARAMQKGGFTRVIGVGLAQEDWRGRSH
ncbi:MAG: phosphoribosyltransferase family protein [Candidatus Roizmanbacteria bacterium]